MRGKWAAGIPPRNFTWIIKGRLAVSERPGGFAANHRRVRRQEEIIWLRGQGFTRIVSLMSSPHNLQAYEDHELASANYAVTAVGDQREVLADLYQDLGAAMSGADTVLVHQDELGDRTTGAMAGFLVWSGRAESAAQAVWLLEKMVGRQMGSVGRGLVVAAAEIVPSGET